MTLGQAQDAFSSALQLVPGWPGMECLRGRGRFG